MLKMRAIKITLYKLLVTQSIDRNWVFCCFNFIRDRKKTLRCNSSKMLYANPYSYSLGRFPIFFPSWEFICLLSWNLGTKNVRNFLTFCCYQLLHNSFDNKIVGAEYCSMMRRIESVMHNKILSYWMFLRVSFLRLPRRTFCLIIFYVNYRQQTWQQIY